MAEGRLLWRDFFTEAVSSNSSRFLMPVAGVFKCVFSGECVCVGGGGDEQ